MKPKITWLGVAVIIGLILLLAILLLPALSRARESARRASCQNNLKELGLVMKMYANESQGERFPPLSSTPGNWMMDMDTVYPEYLSDIAVLICPAHPEGGFEPFTLKRNLDHPGYPPGGWHPDCVWGRFYTYTGFSVFSDEQAAALYAASYSDGWEAIRDSDLELEVPVWKGSQRVEEVGRSGIPILWDRLPADVSRTAHIGGGYFINVLHTDGSVMSVRYAYDNGSNNFPATWTCSQLFGNDVPRLNRDCYAQ